MKQLLTFHNLHQVCVCVCVCVRWRHYVCFPLTKHTKHTKHTSTVCEIIHDIIHSWYCIEACVGGSVATGELTRFSWRYTSMREELHRRPPSLEIRFPDKSIAYFPPHPETGGEGECVSVIQSAVGLRLTIRSVSVSRFSISSILFPL